MTEVLRDFGSDAPLSYRLNRKQLFGTGYSTKFPPWLAVGTLSPHTVFQTLKARLPADKLRKSTPLFLTNSETCCANRRSDPTPNNISGRRPIHRNSAYTIAALVAPHAAGALKHQFVYRDDVLKRMAPK